MATFKWDEWRWKCCDCRIEYFVEDYRFCPRCGRARPFTLRMKEITSTMAALDERDEVMARIESLERHCQCKGPPLSERVGALEAWQRDVMAEPFRQWQAVKLELAEQGGGDKQPERSAG